MKKPLTVENIRKAIEILENGKPVITCYECGKKIKNNQPRFGKLLGMGFMAYSHIKCFNKKK